jgi:hypothetical protein
MMEHLHSIYHKKDATGIHFSSSTHNHNDFRVQVIEKVLPNTVNHRLEREEYWIRVLGTNTPLGLNKQDKAGCVVLNTHWYIILTKCSERQTHTNNKEVLTTLLKNTNTYVKPNCFSIYFILSYIYSPIYPPIIHPNC